MNTDERLMNLARILAYSLERLSADSTWAHKASGVRGSLLRALVTLEEVSDPTARIFLIQGEFGTSLEKLLDLGFDILEKAAQEIPVPEDLLNRYKNIQRAEDV